MLENAPHRAQGTFALARSCPQIQENRAIEGGQTSEESLNRHSETEADSEARGQSSDSDSAALRVSAAVDQVVRVVICVCFS